MKPQSVRILTELGFYQVCILSILPINMESSELLLQTRIRLIYTGTVIEKLVHVLWFYVIPNDIVMPCTGQPLMTEVMLRHCTAAFCHVVWLDVTIPAHSVIDCLMTRRNERNPQPLTGKDFSKTASQMDPTNRRRLPLGNCPIME